MDYILRQDALLDPTAYHSLSRTSMDVGQIMSSLPVYTSQRRPEMVGFVPHQRSKVLEIGCAEGDFLASLPGVSERWGIEPSPSANVASTRLHHVFQSTFDEAEQHLPLGHFNVILCNDVIEHLPDHDEFFSKISRYLAPGGVIVGSVPNVRFYNNLFQMLFEKDWHYTEYGILDRTHTRFFTEKSLKKCLERHGLHINTFRGLKHNIALDGSSRSRAYLLLSKALIGLTLGYFSDIQYLQFGFQAQPTSDSIHGTRPTVNAA